MEQLAAETHVAAGGGVQHIGAVPERMDMHLGAIEPGQRIAQLIICPVARAYLVEVDELDDTARGSGGFGHTE